MSDDIKWSYSFNGENFEGEFDTKNDAIEEAMYYAKDWGLFTDIYVGTIKKFVPSANVDWLLESVQQDAYEECGEYAEDYLEDVKVKHRNILEERIFDVLSEWMKEFGYEPRFWIVENIEKVQED